MSTPLILPDSRTRALTGLVWRGEGFGWWVPVFCANCGAAGGFVPEGVTHVFYLCDTKCAPTLGHIEGLYTEPDTVFRAKILEEQMDRYGRELTPLELLAQLDDVNSPLSRMARERAQLTPSAR